MMDAVGDSVSVSPEEIEEEYAIVPTLRENIDRILGTMTQ